MMALMAPYHRAQSIALRSMPKATLFSVIVEVSPADAEIVGYQFGFQQRRSSWFRGERLQACWVRTSADGAKADLASSGTFGQAQLAQLSTIAEWPPPALPIEEAAMDPRLVLKRLRSDLVDGALTGSVTLSLCMFESHLAWRAIYERQDGVSTVILAARDGHVLFEKFDQAARE